MLILSSGEIKTPMLVLHDRRRGDVNGIDHDSTRTMFAFYAFGNGMGRADYILAFWGFLGALMGIVDFMSAMSFVAAGGSLARGESGS